MTEKTPNTTITPFRIDIPQADLDDLRARLDQRALAGRAAGRRRLRGQPVLRPLTGGSMAERLRLASGRGPDQPVPAVHDRDRRPAHPLPPRSFARARRVAADRDPRLAGIDRGVPGHHRTAYGSPEPWWRPRERFPPRHPVHAGLWLLWPYPRARLEPLSNRRGLGGADAPARLRAVWRGGQRRRIDDLARGGPTGSRARHRGARHADLLVPLGRPVRIRRHDRGGGHASSGRSSGSSRTRCRSTR